MNSRTSSAVKPIDAVVSREATTLDDERELVERARHDRAAFGQLYRRHVKRIYAYIYRRTSDHTLAEDLTTAVFEEALRSIGRFKWQGVPFSAWLYRLAHTQVAQHHRRQSRRPKTVPLDESLPEPAAGQPEQQAAAREERRNLKQSLANLSPKDQEIIHLTSFEDLTTP
ncbi:MAG: RNA polymerase sigma factor, partial [Anaerolineales bacterium]